MPAPARPRERGDVCPGVFAPHDAADGALARVRLPGGAISASALRAVAECAEELGDGRVHLTSRGNLQLRGLTRTPALAARLAAAGLLPSATHERVRNVLASPLSGIAGSTAPSALRSRSAAHPARNRHYGSEVRDMAVALDRALCARPALARLPGRFLFALDDGRGDVAAEEPDLCWQAVSARAVPPSAGRAVSTGPGLLRVAGVAVAAVEAADAVPALLDAAEVFLRLRAADGGTAWRAAELPDGPARIAAVLGSMPQDDGLRPSQQGGLTAVGLVQGHLAANPTPAAPTLAAPSAARPGPVHRDDGGLALVVAPVLGELTAAQVRLLADAATPAGLEPATPGSEGPRSPAAVVTPWRTIVLPDPVLPAAQLAHAGLVVAPGPAADLSACAGRPGCAKALADVRADARGALGLAVADRLPAGRVHVSGCARRCGAPRAPHIDAVALDGGGYLVDGVPRPGLVP